MGNKRAGFQHDDGNNAVNVTYPEEHMYIMIDYVTDHGKVAILEMGNETNYALNGGKPYNFIVLDEQTGKLDYKGGAMYYPWADSAFGAYNLQSAYGLFYRESYNYIYAFYWDNGSIAWAYELPTYFAFETPSLIQMAQGCTLGTVAQRLLTGSCTHTTPSTRHSAYNARMASLLHQRYHRPRYMEDDWNHDSRRYS